MYLSINIDASPKDEGTAAFAHLIARAARIEAAAADFAIIAREAPDGAMAPSRVEAVVAMPWLAGRLHTPVVVAAIPALHSVPFHVARALSAADFLSDGRAGWMPLTSERDRYDAAYGESYTLPDAEVTVKYDDFIRATHALWDSWDDDALVIDKASGVYLDSGKVRRVGYRGPYFATMGALNAARPPQGHPLLVRDAGDVADSTLACDVLLGDRAQLDAAGATGAIRLLKATAETAKTAIAAIEQGAADGLHLFGPTALDTLEALRAQYPAAARTGATARGRLGLAKPANPYSEKAAA